MSVFETLLYPLTWVLNHTIYYVFQGLAWLICQILPYKYTMIFNEFMGIFWNGIVKTLYLAFFGTIFGLLLACVLGVVRTIKIKKHDHILIKIIKYTTNKLITIYVTFFRGTPMIVQSMIIYYAFYKLIGWKPFDAAMVTVTINTCAYLTEVIRSSIESVDPGQMEAARSLGFSYPKSLFLVVFPQALKNAMASIGNEFIINIKDTSVLNVIGCMEMYAALSMASGRYGFFLETMIAGSLIYLLLTYSLTKLLNFVERKLDAPVKDLSSCN